MSDEWSALQYLKFEDERTRAARDSLAHGPLQLVKRAVTPGCGPGNSTELIVERDPEALGSGLDSSADMLRQARVRPPGWEFPEGDLASGTPDADVDLLFANAVYQGVPNHLSAGAVLAAQMPDNKREPSHLLMARMAGDKDAARDDLPPAGAYYDALEPLSRSVEIRQTVYHHVMAGPGAIVDWFAGNDTGWTEDFLRRDTDAIPAEADGAVLLRLPRLFPAAVL